MELIYIYIGSPEPDTSISVFTIYTSSLAHLRPPVKNARLISVAVAEKLAGGCERRHFPAGAAA